MLSNTFQQDIPNSMLMFPASNEAELPATFAEFAEVVEDPYMLDPEIIERNRNNWMMRKKMKSNWNSKWKIQILKELKDQDLGKYYINNILFLNAILEGIFLDKGTIQKFNSFPLYCRRKYAFNVFINQIHFFVVPVLHNKIF